MNNVRIVTSHGLAQALFFGPNYQGTITFARGIGEGDEKHDVIAIAFPFRFKVEDSIIETIFEEMSTGIYLPRSEATRGLTKKGESDGKNKI